MRVDLACLLIPGTASAIFPEATAAMTATTWAQRTVAVNCRVKFIRQIVHVSVIYLYVADSENIFPKTLSPEVLQAMKSVRFIAQHIKDADKDNEVRCMPCRERRYLFSRGMFVCRKSQYYIISSTVDRFHVTRFTFMR